MTWDGGDKADAQTYVSLSTYVTMWRHHYPDLKVSNLAEVICGAVEVGGGGEGGEGGLRDHDDAAIGMINVAKCNDGANKNKMRWQQQLGHCRVI